jgi:hypothetical protein
MSALVPVIRCLAPRKYMPDHAHERDMHELLHARSSWHLSGFENNPTCSLSDIFQKSWSLDAYRCQLEPFQDLFRVLSDKYVLLWWKQRDNHFTHEMLRFHPRVASAWNMLYSIGSPTHVRHLTTERALSILQKFRDHHYICFFRATLACSKPS